MLVVGTPILLWPRQREMLSARRLELALLLALTAGLSVAISLADLPAALLMLPVVAWAAIRIGDIAVVLAGAIKELRPIAARRRAAALAGEPDPEAAVPGPALVGGFGETPGFRLGEHLAGVLAHGTPPPSLLRQLLARG